jgi:glucokinase
MSEKSRTVRDNHAIGLDVGGTKIAGGMVALENGQVSNRQIIPTRPERGGRAVLEDCLGLAADLLDRAENANTPVSGIGVGVAELVDLDGNVTSDQTIAWRDLPIRAAFSALVPAVVESDVRAAALAEAWYGAGANYELFVYLTVGTGISSCLVQNGRPFAGARGNALVLASSPLWTLCASCDKGIQPVLEEIASGPALVSRYNRSGNAARPAGRGEDVVEAAAQGDLAALHVIETGARALGAAVGWLVNVLDPQAVVVGGGLGLAGGLYWEHMVNAAREHVYAENTRQLPIIPAALGEDAGLVGAAAAVERVFLS